MKIATIAESKTLGDFIISMIAGDLSCRASLWYLPDILAFSDGGKLLPISLSSTLSNSAMGAWEDISVRNTESSWQEAISYKPKTPLGQKLWAIRARIIASGEPLLDGEGIEKEIADIRGNQE